MSRALRLAVTGREGQIVRALRETAERDEALVVIPLGRPELDLADPRTIGPAIAAARPDLVVSAAAYTAVDRAEEERDLAQRVNGDGAGLVAAAAARLGVPVVHLSTDYVFDGAKPTPYVESDPVAPATAYGVSKLAGERAVAAAMPDHAILRTAWVYSPFGQNFVRTMLRLAEANGAVRVVADQIGNPTSALDIAAGILAVGRNLLDRPGEAGLRGVFHMAGAGEATWADFAEAVFAGLARRGGRRVAVTRITTAEFPRPALRPANSRLDCGRLAAAHGVRLPDWRRSLERTLDQLLASEEVFL